MASWMLKAAVQGTLSLLPASQRWNYLFQKYVTRTLPLTAQKFEFKVDQCRQHIENYLRFSSHSAVPQTVIELGTGWQPIITVGLSLSGIDHILSVDIQPLLRREEIREVLQFFVDYAQAGKLSTILPYASAERIELLQDCLALYDQLSREALFTKMGIQCLVTDARKMSLQSQTIPFFVSNSTLEHVPPEVIRDIFAEFRRLAAPDAIMSHWIDVSDHYANTDRAISAHNFLKYPDRTWRFFNNSLQYHNRLRIADHQQLHQAAGFRILHQDYAYRDPEALKVIPLADQFKKYTLDELGVTSAWIISTPDL